MTLAPRSWPSSPGLRNDHADPACHPPDCMSRRPPSGPGERGSILYALSPVTDRTDPYEIIGVRRDASLAEIRISYRRSTQILAPERFANANDTVRAEAARRLSALNGAMESIEAERAAESGSALGSLTFGGPAVSPAIEPSLRSIAIVDEPPPLAPPQRSPMPKGTARSGTTRSTRSPSTRPRSRSTSLRCRSPRSRRPRSTSENRPPRSRSSRPAWPTRPTSIPLPPKTSRSHLTPTPRATSCPSRPARTRARCR